jgi:glutamate decarboxylase
MSVRLSEHPTKAFEILHKPEMNILLFRYIPKQVRNEKSLDTNQNQVCNDLCKMIHLKQNQRVDKSHGFTSRTNVLYKGERVDCFRVVIANPLTEWKHIEELINDYIKLGIKCEDDLDYERLEKKVLAEYPFEGSDKGFWFGWPCDL